jgi:hypothetical protein
VFEVRVVVGRDPLTGNSVQRSFTVRGDAEHAEARRRELVADHATRPVDPPCLGHHGWRPSDSLVRRRPRVEAVDAHWSAALDQAERNPVSSIEQWCRAAKVHAQIAIEARLAQLPDSRPDLVVSG